MSMETTNDLVTSVAERAILPRFWFRFRVPIFFPTVPVQVPAPVPAPVPVPVQVLVQVPTLQF
jgi:hypothetical protein